MCVCVFVCVHAHAHMYVLRIVSTDKILCLINTFIIIIIIIKHKYTKQCKWQSQCEDPKTFSCIFTMWWLNLINIPVENTAQLSWQVLWLLMGDEDQMLFLESPPLGCIMAPLCPVYPAHTHRSKSIHSFPAEEFILWEQHPFWKQQ